MALKLLVVTLIFVANPCQFISEQLLNENSYYHQGLCNLCNV